MSLLGEIARCSLHALPRIGVLDGGEIQLLVKACISAQDDGSLGDCFIGEGMFIKNTQNPLHVLVTPSTSLFGVRESLEKLASIKLQHFISLALLLTFYSAQ